MFCLQEEKAHISEDTNFSKTSFMRRKKIQCACMLRLDHLKPLNNLTPEVHDVEQEAGATILMMAAVVSGPGWPAVCAAMNCGSERRERHGRQSSLAGTGVLQQPPGSRTARREAGLFGPEQRHA
jgi:hypothetical protein